MSIQEHLNKIRNAIYGREVRESIAKGIETAYDDASENGNANMEVKIARGTHPNLRSRLEEVDNKQQQTTSQLAQTETQLSNANTNISNLKTTKADKNYVDNSLANKRDKTTSILLEDLHTEVKSAMVGGSVAVVGENAVGTENLKNEAVTSLKRTSLGEFAMLQISSEPPNFDFTNRKLIIPSSTFGNHEVVHRRNMHPLPSGEIVIDLELEGTYRRGFITFDVKSSSFKTYHGGNMATITEDEVMIGVYHLSARKAYLNCPYLIDGRPPTLTSGLTVDMITDIPHMWKYCTVLLGGQNLPLVDNNAKILRFPSNSYDTIIYVGGTAYTMSPPKAGLNIDLSTSTGTSSWCVLFNTTNKEFVISRWNEVSNFSFDHAIFATFRIANGKYYFNMPCPFLVDGKLYGYSDVTNIIQNPMNANVKAVAHRGYSSEAPENTLPAYRLAKEKGFSYVECDVEWSNDGIPVLLHDGTVDRTSNGTGAVDSLTLEQLKLLDFGSWKGAEYVGTKIPTFEEFIILCKKLNLHPYIETKGGINEEQAELLISIVKKLGMIENVTWISFSLPSLTLLSSLLANVRLGYVGTLTESFIAAAKNLKNETNSVFIDARHSSVTKELSENALLSDIPIEVWIVNNSTLLEGLVEKGVSGITTDLLNVAEILSN